MFSFVYATKSETSIAGEFPPLKRVMVLSPCVMTESLRILSPESFIVPSPVTGLATVKLSLVPSKRFVSKSMFVEFVADKFDTAIVSIAAFATPSDPPFRFKSELEK